MSYSEHDYIPRPGQIGQESIVERPAERAGFFLPEEDQEHYIGASEPVQERAVPLDQIRTVWGEVRFDTIYTAAVRTGVPDVPAWLEHKFALENREPK